MSGSSRPALRFVGALALTITFAASSVRADGDAAKGEKLFETCHACHSVEAGQNGLGPSLHGLIGRKAGEVPDFRYSPGMKRSGITWSAKLLDDFIADPQKTVPANRMPYAGNSSAGERADLIAYLEKATK
jgi:cytochrome c2